MNQPKNLYPREHDDAGPQVEPAIAPAKVKPRVGVVETAYHQDVTGEMHPFETRFSRDLETEEQMWVRHGSVGSSWAELEVGWIDGGCSVLVLRNDGAKGGGCIEAALQDDRGLFALCTVPPGESVRLTNCDPRRFAIRSTATDALRYALFLVPK